MNQRFREEMLNSVRELCSEEFNHVRQTQLQIIARIESLDRRLDAGEIEIGELRTEVNGVKETLSREYIRIGELVRELAKDTQVIKDAMKDNKSALEGYLNLRTTLIQRAVSLPFLQLSLLLLLLAMAGFAIALVLSKVL